MSTEPAAAHVELFNKEFLREVDRLRREEKSRDGAARQRLAELEIEIGNLAANMLAGVVSPVIAQMLEQREAEAEELKLRLGAGDVAPVNVIPHSALRARFEQRVANLRESLSDPENRADVANVLANLIEEIVIHPADIGASPDVEITADLSKMVGFANAKGRPPQMGRLSKVR